MKLIQKTTLYYLAYILIIFIIGATLFYFLIRMVLLDSIDEGLRQERDQIVNNLMYEREIEELIPSKNVIIHKLPSYSNEKDEYKIVPMFDQELQEEIDYRQLKSNFTYNNGYYQITIRHSLQEAETLLKGLFPIVIIMFLFVLTGVFLINQLIIKKLWEPFYHLLQLLRNYDLNKSKNIPYQHSNIQEFNELSLSVEKMTSRIYNDFLAQKEFNENASHELQTPLAVIKNKLDLLIQSANLKEEDMEAVRAIYASVRKLTSLNKGLNLLSKIDNRQFVQTETIIIKNIITRLLQEFSDQIQEKELKVTININENASINANAILTDILFSNLISNAIKHNLFGGEINIYATSSHFSIENTGKALSVSSETMFGRFKKDSDNPQSIGLGLAIVKKICDSFGYTVQYHHENSYHSLHITF
ncbi:MAG TPA: HAMP domain-containing sensor histidine kinase [Cytophagaceae bacterium]